MNTFKMRVVDMKANTESPIVDARQCGFCYPREHGKNGEVKRRSVNAANRVCKQRTKMKKTLAIIAALGMALAQTNAEQGGCLTQQQTSYYGELGGSAGSALGEDNGSWNGFTGNPYIWVKWHGIVARDVVIHSWRVGLTGYIYNTGMAVRVGVKDTELAKQYYLKCGSGYSEVGIEIIVFEAGTTNVVSKVTNRRVINPAG